MRAPRTAAPRPADWFLPAAAPGPGQEISGRAAASYWAAVWRRFRQNAPASAALACIAAMVAMSAVGPYLAHVPYDRLNLTAENLPPGPGHWLGTDELGRDVWARTWMGGRVSLFIGLAAAAIDLGIGAVYGGVAGLAGGALDGVMMRVVDVLYGLPFLLVAILLLAVVGPGLRTIVAAIALINWLGMARLVRGQVLELKNREFVLAARALGVPWWRILIRHLLPNAMGPMLVWISYTVPSAIFTEAFLSYLGLGVQAPLTSWGAMISDGTETFRTHPYPFLFPAIALSLTMLAFYLVSDALQDALDPRSAP
jgi:ABC-type dipeptide/oligopeptide/nickel transport system permease subunit